MESKSKSLAKGEDAREPRAESKIDYQALEALRAEAVLTQLRQELSRRDLDDGDAFRNLTMRFVVDAKYTEAGYVIDEYVKSKTVYPQVQRRVAPHVAYAKELINAIKAKRNFPNLGQLSMSKQQEILDHAVGHFDDLRATLKAIKRVAREESVRDVRSTVWVVKSLLFVTALFLVSLFIIDFKNMFGPSFWFVFNDSTDSAFEVIARYLPFL